MSLQTHPRLFSLLARFKVLRLVSIVLGLIGSLAYGQSGELPPEIGEAMGLAKGEIVVLRLDPEPGKTVVSDILIQNEEYELELHPHSVRSEDMVLLEQVGDGSYVARQPEPPRTIRGALRGSKGSRVIGSLLDNGLYAMMIMGDDRVYFIEPIVAKLANEFADGTHVIYRSVDMRPHPGKCGLGGKLVPFERVRLDNEKRRAGIFDGHDFPLGTLPGDQIAELAVDADFEYFSDYGTVQATMDRMELVINVMNNQYESQVDISHVISAAIVRSTSADPYTSSDPQTLLSQFRTEWLNNQPTLPRDVAHLFTGRELDGSVIGIAWDIGAICTTNAYCLSQSDFNGNFGCATDLSAHELGHLWDAIHCTCPSTTMNASITCANSFDATLTIPDIIAHRNSRTCLQSASSAPNDDWTNKIPVGTLPAVETGSNVNATTQSGEQDLTQTGATVWWSAIAPSNGMMRVNTTGSNFDTQLHIYTGSQNGFANLQRVAFNDDANGTLQSEIQFPVNSGQRYEIRVGGFTNGGAPAQGNIQLLVSFTPVGSTDFFISSRALNSGAVNTSNATAFVTEGSSGSIYIYYDASFSDMNTGAVLDIATSTSGVIEFTNADAPDFEIVVSGVPVNDRWGDAFGNTGTVTPNFIDEHGAFTVVNGTGILNQNTGPTFFDQGYDANAGAFLFSRIDYNAVGPVGSSVDIILSDGDLGIVHNGTIINPAFGSIRITVTQNLPPTSDFFWSTFGLNSGAVNSSMPVAFFSEGSSGSLFLYYDTMTSEMDTGAFLDIATSTPGVIEFTAAESFDFPITVMGIPVDLRWGDAFGNIGAVSPNFIDEFGAFTVINGTGILNQNTGPTFFDQGYDPVTGAFLFGRIDFNVVGPLGSSVDIISTPGALGIVNNGMLIDPILGIATIMVDKAFLLGDINCDGVVDLLDVAPFINLLTTGGYSPKGDFNNDGAITLLDVQPFVILLAGG